MKKRVFALFFIVIVLLPLLQSCLKSNLKFTYTLKGRIMSSNSGQPLEGIHLVLYTPLKGLGGSGGGEEIGNTFTDSNGNFIIGNIPTKHNRDLEFFGEFIPVFTITPVPKNGDTIDRGDIYINE